MKLLSKKIILPIAIISGIVATGVGFSIFGSSPVLPESSQKKMDQLSSVERVKALNNSPKIKKDMIADEKTQQLLAEAGNPIGLPERKKDKEVVNLAPPVNDTNPSILKVSSSEIKKEIPDSKCTEYDNALGKCKLPDNYQNKVEQVSNVISSNTKPSLSDSTVDGSAKISDAKLNNLKIPSDDNNKNTVKSESKTAKIDDDSPLGLLVATSGKLESLSSRNISIGGAENQIKAGTTVLAVLNEAKTITSTGETYASASVIGAPFDKKKFPEGVTLLLKMKLNGTQDGIEGQIVSCSSRRNNDKSIPCAAQLEDITGASALRGDVYSNTGWQIVTTAATTFLAGLSLSKITTSATQLGTTVDQSASNALYQALSGAITNMGQQIAASFARSGTQISIPGRVVVRVLFTKDSVW